MKTELRGLVFDLDGTLYLQGPLRRHMMRLLLRAGVKHPISTWQDLRALQHYRRVQEELRVSGEPLAAEQLPIAAAQCPNPERARAAICRWMEDTPLGVVGRHLRPGIVEFLSAAKQAGIRLGLLSDYPAERKLAALGMAQYFSAVLCAQDARVGVFKPDPKGLTAVLAELGVPAAHAVYIGDRAAVDGAAAHRAGVACLILGRRSTESGPGWKGAPDVRAARALLAI